MRHRRLFGRKRPGTGTLLVGLLVLGVVTCGEGQTLTVSEAKSASGLYSVTGFLVATGDVVRLCATLAESFPPQCGEASIEVQGLDLSTIPEIETESDVSWTDEPVTLTGVIESGVLEAEKQEG